MRISLLLEREPFGAILEQTLPALLARLTGRAHAVRWYGSRSRRGRARGREQTWLCNPLLNVIFRPPVDPAALRPVMEEFGRSAIWWRRPFQRAYALTATRRPWAGLLAGPRLGVTPSVPGADALVVLGGNHRLRLLDPRARVAHVVAKAGADSSLMRAEIDLRRTASDLPIPALHEIDEGGRWFTEALVGGTPLNRLAGRCERERALGTARAALVRLVERTSREVPVAQYVGTVLADLRHRVATAPLLSARRIDIERAMHTLAGVAESPPRSSTITTAQTHGDFQTGNVLAEGNGIWLIDWEYTARRQSGYDALTFAFGARFPVGLAERIRAATVAPGPALEFLLEWPGLEWVPPHARRRTLAIFLLEELTLHVRENAGSRLRSLTPGTDRFLDEVEMATQHLARGAA